jgi:hypothetical protein
MWKQLSGFHSIQRASDQTSSSQSSVSSFRFLVSLLAISLVENLRKINRKVSRFRGRWGVKDFGYSSYFLGYPPSPHPRNGLLGAGLAKSVCKILNAKNLEVKILSAKDLGGATMYAHPTVTASTMISQV